MAMVIRKFLGVILDDVFNDVRHAATTICVAPRSWRLLCGFGLCRGSGQWRTVAVSMLVFMTVGSLCSLIFP